MTVAAGTVALNISYEELLSTVIDNDEKVASSKKHTQFKTRVQKPCPIYDQNLWFLLPYLWPDQIFDTLFMIVAAGTVALNISYEELLLTVIDNDEK